jgi:HlyD family secretion protein
LSPFEGVILLVILAIAGYGGYLLYAKVTDLNAPVETPPVYIPAFRTNLTSTVSGTGTVQSNQQVTLTFGTAGKIKEFLVPLGAQVVAGQPLARLDDTQLLQAVSSAEANLASAQARLDAVLKGPSEADIRSSEQSLASGRGQLATAQRNLDDILAKPTASEIATAQQALLQAQNTLQNAIDAYDKAVRDAAQAVADYDAAVETTTSTYNALKSAHSLLLSAFLACSPPLSISEPSLPSKGAPAAAAPSITLAECGNDAAKLAAYNAALAGNGGYNAARTAYNSALTAEANRLAAMQTARRNVDSEGAARSLAIAQLGLQNAQTKLNETLAGPKPADIEGARLSLESAKASLATAQARYDALFKPPEPETLLPLQASVEQARANLETAKKNLQDATIVAPFAGQISQINGEVGSQVGATTAVFILLNPRLIRIDAQIDQADISKLSLGQTVTATFDALTGRSYSGAITAIGLTPTTQQGVVTYTVTIGVDTSRLAEGTPIPAPGMTASISILTSRVENALVVPSRSVRTVARTQRSVQVQKPDGTTETRTVQVGASSGNLTQIVSGLEEGEWVLYSAAATATTSTTTTGGQQQFIFPGGGGLPGGGGFPIGGGQP